MNEISDKGYNIMQRALDQAAGRFGNIKWCGDPQKILREYIATLEANQRPAPVRVVRTDNLNLRGEGFFCGGCHRKCITSKRAKYCPYCGAPIKREAE